MARSNYVYIVQDYCTGRLCKAFTVKHEMIDWVREAVLVLPKFIVFRLPDGGSHARHNQTYIYTEKELFE